MQETPKNTSSGEILLSRRNFLFGIGAASAALGAAALGASGCASSKNISEAEANALIVDTYGASTSSADAISVSEDAVFTIDSCEHIENLDDVVEQTAKASLPFGSMLWSSDSHIAACLLPCDTSVPLTNVGILTLSDGNMKTVLESAVGQSEGFEIYDVRANSYGVVWTEADILNNEWRIYTATLDAKGALSCAPVLAVEGNSDWTCPSLLVNEENAFWYTTPKSDGKAASEPGVIMRIAFGHPAEEAVTLLAVTSALPCDITPTAKGLAVATRIKDKKGAYQLLHIDGAGGEIVDRMVLPQGMKPTFVSHGTSGFSFAFEDIYSFGKGISNLGTYTPAEGKVDGMWFRFAKTPYEPAAWTSNWFLVKSTGVVAGVDFDAKRYFTIESEKVTQGYGEFLASSATNELFVTYSNIDYTPLNGVRTTHCNVRVWRLK